MTAYLTLNPIKILLLIDSIVVGFYILLSLSYIIPSILHGQRKFNLVLNQLKTWTTRHVLCIITLVVMYLSLLSAFTNEFDRGSLYISFNFLIILFNLTHINNTLRALWTCFETRRTYYITTFFIFVLPLTVIFALFFYISFKNGIIPDIDQADMLVINSITSLSFYVLFVGDCFAFKIKTIDRIILMKDADVKNSLIAVTLVFDATWIFGLDRASVPYFLSLCIYMYIAHFDRSMNSIIFINNNPEVVVTQDERQVLRFLYNRAKGNGQENYMDLNNIKVLRRFISGSSQYKIGNLESKDELNGHKNNFAKSDIPEIQLDSSKHKSDEESEQIKLEDSNEENEPSASHFQPDTTVEIDQIPLEDSDEEREGNAALDNQSQTFFEEVGDYQCEIHYPIDKSFFSSKEWVSLFRKIDKYVFLSEYGGFEHSGRDFIMRERYDYRNFLTDMIYKDQWDSVRNTLHNKEPEQIEMTEF
jgi:hypothetical protein